MPRRRRTHLSRVLIRLIPRERVASIPLPKTAAAAAKTAAAAAKPIKYIWRCSRPNDSRIARLIVSTAYQATMRVDKDATTILLRLIPRELGG
ncbi:hypothetical protein G6O67_003595 [Ophiocordyceps sinensis]|uniref:Uncharacterized protein n=1 Tax=Ophiocordyceps sinensis TaxID=72228 RepID=A0A8H4V659_9HYPO|nr:hypothetical protein G6O67_003595 [Ophiocordyceps sinensis]